MRHVLFLLAVCLAATTCSGKKKNLPPPERFYFPSGIHHADKGPGSEGVLYVVNANFDRRYDTGTMTAVDLDAVGLPPFGQPAGSAPVSIMNLAVDGGPMVVELANFGGDLGTTTLPDGTVRMFVPSRAEGQKLMVVDARGTNLSCVQTLWADGGSRGMPLDERDCGEVGASLVEYERFGTGIPRADSPLSATVDSDGVVWVTSGKQSDTPRFSLMGFNDFIVRMRGDDLRVGFDNFIGLGVGSTHAVAAGRRWVYFSGRFPTSVVNPPLVRLVDRLLSPRDGGTEPAADGGAPTALDGGFGFAIFNPVLEREINLAEARGIALSSDEHRLYLAGRQSTGAMGSDLLVVAKIANPLADDPGITLLRTVPVPAEPLMVKVVPRGVGRGDLVFIACGFGFGSLVIYDDERGDRAAQLDGVGPQASSIAVDVRQNGAFTGARVYVTAFTDGRVSVIDVPNLDQPEDARIVASLGVSQVCLTRRDVICDGGVPP